MMKARMRAGLVLGLAAVLLGLGACSGAFSPQESLDEQETKEQTIPNAEGRVLVKVGLGTGSSSRSVLPGMAERYVDFYEVVFRDTAPVGTEAAYYRGTGTNKDSSLKVWVLPGKKYEVLLLAGKGNILLAAGYKGAKAANLDTDGPVEIKKGEANTVSIALTPFPLQWDTAISTGSTHTWTTGSEITNTNGGTDYNIVANDVTSFGFAANLAINPNPYSNGNPAVILGDRYVNLAPVVSGTATEKLIDPSKDTFTVAINFADFTPLILADKNTTIDDTPKITENLTFADYKVRLWPRYVEDNFPPVTLSGPTTTDLASGTVLPSIAFTNVPATDTNRLPNWDVDCLLQCDLKYYAFGTPDSKGTAWIIRNGIDGTSDSTPSAEAHGTTGTAPGSFFVVKIGRGSPAAREEVQIISGW